MKRNWFLVLLLFAAFGGFLTSYLHRVPNRHYCDYRVYYKAGQDILSGKNIYFRETEDITPFKYSPFFAFVFAPLSLLPIKVSAAVFFTINFVFTILFFVLSWEIIENSGIFSSISANGRLLVYGLSLLCSMRYILLVWDSGQVNILMCVLALASLRFLSQGKSVLSGALLAAAMLIKYTPALFLLYFLFQRRFKAAAWTLLFVVVFLAAPIMIVGVEKEIFYLKTWFPSIIATSLDQGSYIDMKNQSIFSMAVRFLSPTWYHVQLVSLSFNQALLIGRIAMVLLYLPVFIPGRSRPRDMVIDSAILLICMSLFNPNGWLLNFVSLILGYMFLIRYTLQYRMKDVIVPAALIMALIMSNIMSKDILGKAAENLGCEYCFTTFGALIIYSVLLKLKFSKSS